jgi:hypothetical protein
MTSSYTACTLHVCGIKSSFLPVPLAVYLVTFESETRSSTGSPENERLYPDQRKKKLACSNITNIGYFIFAFVEKIDLRFGKD